MKELISAIKLVREEFPDMKIQDFKEFPAKDRTELASAIARQRSIPQEDLGFELVAY